MERRETRSVNQFSLKPEPCADGSFKGYYKLDRINSVAGRDREAVFNNLSQLLSEDNLRQVFRGLDGSKAVGIDLVTKNEYEKDSAEYGDLSVDIRSFSVSGNNEMADLLDDEDGDE